MQNIKKPLDVSSSQISLQSRCSFSNCATLLLSSRADHEGRDHSDWSCSKSCTTRRPYDPQHMSRVHTCHYRDPWWKMDSHDDNQGNLQQCLSIEIDWYYVDARLSVKHDLKSSDWKTRGVQLIPHLNCSVLFSITVTLLRIIITMAKCVCVMHAQIIWHYAFEFQWSLCLFSHTKVQFTHFSICDRYAS